MLRNPFAIPGLLLLGMMPVASALLGARPGPLHGLPPPQDMPFTVAGKIIKVESGKITLSTQDNMVFFVRFDDKTEILRQDGSPGKTSDLRPGIQISVVGDLGENGDVLAKKIRLQAEGNKNSGDK